MDRRRSERWADIKDDFRDAEDLSAYGLRTPGYGYQAAPHVASGHPAPRGKTSGSSGGGANRGGASGSAGGAANRGSDGAGQTAHAPEGVHSLKNKRRGTRGGTRNRTGGGGSGGGGGGSGGVATQEHKADTSVYATAWPSVSTPTQRWQPVQSPQTHQTQQTHQQVQTVAPDPVAVSVTSPTAPAAGLGSDDDLAQASLSQGGDSRPRLQLKPRSTHLGEVGGVAQVSDRTNMLFGRR